MRFNELDQPSVGDILELELGDEIVEAVITAIEGDEIIAETDNMQGARLLAESYGKYYCSTDKKWKERQGPKQSRKTESVEEGAAEGKETPEKELERLKLRQDAEHGKASLQRQAETLARIRELEKEIKDSKEKVDEAEYQGRDVKLGKPMQGDVKKFKVYVKDPKTGNVKKVNFGDPNMRIKKSNPKRRKSFRARHNCANPGPRTKARYWSCRKW